MHQSMDRQILSKPVVLNGHKALEINNFSRYNVHKSKQSFSIGFVV